LNQDSSPHVSGCGFNKEAGKEEDIPIDFEKYDLVIITGRLGI